MKLPQKIIQEAQQYAEQNKKDKKKTMQKVEEEYQRIQVEAGESVGVIAAQSLGEPGTQMTLNTKNLAGVSKMNVTIGLPRIIEIFDARREPSTPMMKIYLTPENAKDEVKAQKIAAKLLEVKVKDVVKNVSIDIVKSKILFDTDPKKLGEYDITAESIAKKLAKNYDAEANKATITIKPKKEVSTEKLYQVKVKIMDTYVSGIKNVEQVLPWKESGEWVIRTLGSNLKEIMKRGDIINVNRTTTNNIHEVAKVLGIEAARNIIIEEVIETLAEQGLEVDVRHIMLVADAMTFSGEVKGTTRYGIIKDKTSILARASYEVPLNNLFTAAVRNTDDRLEGVVENVMINQVIPVGTGLPKLVVTKKGESKK